MNSKNQANGRALFFALALPLLIAGCTKSDSSMNTPSDATANTNAPAVGADNSRNNMRDRDNGTLTPGDQGNAPADRSLTQKIRQALVSGTNSVTGTNDFSMTAKNVKIITVDGKVTLRGPVNTAAEKNGIEAIAQNLAGPGNVNDQLEVKANQ